MKKIVLIISAATAAVKTFFITVTAAIKTFFLTAMAEVKTLALKFIARMARKVLKEEILSNKNQLRDARQWAIAYSKENDELKKTNASLQSENKEVKTRYNYLARAHNDLKIKNKTLQEFIDMNLQNIEILQAEDAVPKLLRLPREKNRIMDIYTTVKGALNNVKQYLQ